jgi:hypothetical protein
MVAFSIFSISIQKTLKLKLMKKNNYNKIGALFLLCLTVFTISCNDDIVEKNQQYPQLNPSNPDTNAGNWSTLVLNAPNEFSIDIPTATNSAAYKAEINEIKSYQANITSEQQQIIDYWSAGGVLRWNEIMQTLVARHNRPPYQNEDGTYPAPSGANPFANPQFPFSNPPYAARAYAYVSAAQYDAMVATWHYKQLYNRAAPFIVDNTIQVLVPKSPLPSYPSEVPNRNCIYPAKSR